jgi:anti-sigma regulatory factor (Ser/Thr protein kinase)
VKGYLHSNLNKLEFTGDFDNESLRRTLAALHNLKAQGYSDVDLSFSGMTRVMTPQMLPLAIYCRRLLHEGFDVKLELPADAKLARLFSNTNWAYLIDPRGHQESVFGPGQHLPALLYTTPEGQFSAVDKAVNLLLQSLKITDRKQVQAVEWSVNEIADNVLNHANSPVGGAMQVTVRPDKNLVEFVVADAGSSIPKTLRESYRKLTSDVEALDLAIREGVTRNTKTNMGNGLFGTFRLAQLSKGRFGLYSGYASLVYNESQELHSQAEKIPFSGSVVECSINIANPELLSEALTFKGQPHSPGYSVVNRMDEDEIKELMLVDEAASFGSRPAARPVKQKIENVIATTSTIVVVNLDGVALVTSSFADEVFGKLFVEMGPMTFMKRVRVKGGSKIVTQLIDRAIMQRTALGTND